MTTSIIFSQKSRGFRPYQSEQSKKGFWSYISTNVVSLVSGIIVGMRLLGRGENYQTVVKILLRWIHFQDCDDHVQGSYTLCLDRGYMNEDLIMHFLFCGFDWDT
jgi:hypothetical protein